jgi:hypothetical protein
VNQQNDVAITIPQNNTGIHVIQDLNDTSNSDDITISTTDQTESSPQTQPVQQQTYTSFSDVSYSNSNTKIQMIVDEETDEDLTI